MLLTRRQALLGAGALWAASLAPAHAAKDAPIGWSAGLGGLPKDAPVMGPDGPTTLGALAAGRPVVLSLWANWCAPCLVEKPHLDELADWVVRENLPVQVLAVETAERSGSASVARARKAFQKLKVVRLTPLADPWAGEWGKGPFGDLVTRGGATYALPFAGLYDAAGAERSRRSGVTVDPSWKPPAKLTPQAMKAAPILNPWKDADLRALLRTLAG